MWLRRTLAVGSAIICLSRRWGVFAYTRCLGSFEYYWNLNSWLPPSRRPWLHLRLVFLLTLRRFKTTVHGRGLIDFLQSLDGSVVYHLVPN